VSDAPPAIRVQGLSKKFGLTLAQSMHYGLRDMAGRVFGRAATEQTLRDGEFWAVHDASFELRPGEALGIMGVNGCGKTTLLRVLNGVYAPDAGRVELRGRVGALIAAGAGFAPMLSGRENVYINGALLGLSTTEIDGLMDEIVAFSELGQFIDLPVRNYSSGMFVRLGFAIAALSRPDILLMDEVLAVGDLNFQKKCFDHILQLKRQGTAIILVSHSPGAIWSVCDRGLFMDHGRVLVDGPVEDIIRAYGDQNARNAATAAVQFDRAVAAHHGEADEPIPADYGHSKGGTGDVVCSRIGFVDVTGHPVAEPEFAFGESFVIEADIAVHAPLEDLLLRYTIDAAHYRYIAILDSYEQNCRLPEVARGDYRLRVRLNAPNLRPGVYTVNMAISRRAVGVHLFYWFGAARFVIRNPVDRFLYADDNAVVHLDAEFTLAGIEAAAPAE
jgi:lipopolysaccharide transport system ATP-binding protein